MPLTPESVESAKPGRTAGGKSTAKPYKMFDTGGLYLEVSPTGGKWWRLKYRFAGREKRISLGVYPSVPLQEARDRSDAARALLDDGIDPSETKKADRAAERAEEARQISETRFTIDNDGALSVRLGTRRVTMTPAETASLRAFLDATRSVTPKVSP